MTIHELLALTGLTESDEIPVWDAEASSEPTKKITAQNFASSIKTLASLLGTGDVVNNLTSTETDKPLAAAQGKALNDNLAHVMGENIELVQNPVAINPSYETIQIATTRGPSHYRYVDLYFVVQGGQLPAVRIFPNYTDKTYKLGFFALHHVDNALRRFALTFDTAGRYLTNIIGKWSYADEAFVDLPDNALYLEKAVGYNY